MANYTTVAKVRNLLGKPTAVIQTEWLDWVDALIEQYIGFGFKGATRTYVHIGSNNTLIRLPSRAETITSIVQEGPDGDQQTMTNSDYRFDSGTRFIDRKLTNPPGLYSYLGRGKWLKNFKYIVTYVEPATPPAVYEPVATEMVKTIFLFMEKNRDIGLANTFNESGTVSSLSGNESKSFPSSLMEELRRIMTQGIRKTGI